MALNYSPRIVTDGLVMCLDASQNKSYPTVDLPVKLSLGLWLDASDDATFSYSSGTAVSQWRDKSGNNFHISQGTVANQPSRSTTQNSRKTVNFDGTNDFLSVSNFVCNSEMSIFVVSNCGGTLFIEHSPEANLNDGFYFYGGGGGMFKIKRSAQTSLISYTNWLSGAYSVASGVNSTGLDLLTYKDGTQQTITTDSRGSITNSYTTNTLYVGSRAGTSVWTSGPIAEIIIFNRKVSDIERKLIHTYLGQKWGLSNADRTFVDLAGNDDNGLLGNGTTANMPTFDYYNKGGFKFDGSNDYAVSSNTTISGDQSFCVWAVTTANTNNPIGILSQHNYASTANFGINQVTSNKLAPSIGYTNGTREFQDKVTTNAISYNQIFNAVLVYNSSENKIYWYFNGAFDSSYALSATPKSTSWPICLGRWDAGYDNYYFAGNIFSALIYNKALSATEVAKNYQAQKAKFTYNIVQQGLVLNLDASNPFSYSGAGTTWYDTSGNNYNATINGAVVYNSSNGGSLDTGSTGTTTKYITIPSAALNGRTSWTIQFWINVNATNSIDSFLTCGAGNDFLWFFSGRTNIEFQNINSSNVAYSTSLGEWFLFTATGSSGSINIYKNGVSINTFANTTTITVNSSVGIVLGQEMDDNTTLNFDSAQAFLGKYGMVSFYNRVLSAAEVLQNYNATKGRFGL